MCNDYRLLADATTLFADFSETKIEIRFSEGKPNLEAREDIKITDTAPIVAKLVNPPSDPAQKPQAKSVLQAVKTCDPLPMPTQYRSFYEQWKTKTIHFDPQVAAR